MSNAFDLMVFTKVTRPVPLVAQGVEHLSPIIVAEELIQITTCRASPNDQTLRLLQTPSFLSVQSPLGMMVIISILQIKKQTGGGGGWGETKGLAQGYLPLHPEVTLRTGHSGFKAGGPFPTVYNAGDPGVLREPSRSVAGSEMFILLGSCLCEASLCIPNSGITHPRGQEFVIVNSC